MTTNQPDAPLMNGRVVIGYDGSEHAERALARAADEAVRRDTGLEIVCGDPWVTPPAPGLGLGTGAGEYRTPRRAVQDMLEHAADRVRKTAPELAVVVTHTEEPAAQALVQAGETAGLIVVGTRGHGGFAGLLLGSVSLRVAAHAPCPLMVVRGDADGDIAGHGTVLAGVQSDADQPALRVAFEEAKRRDARLKVLHAWTYPAPLGGMPTVDAERTREQAEERRKLADSIPRYAIAPLRETYPLVRVETDHELGTAAHVLVEASRTADVVVVAAHRNRHRLGMRLGPVSHALLHHAHCPVILVPVD